jgi:Rieske Fe-S protein
MRDSPYLPLSRRGFLWRVWGAALVALPLLESCGGEEPFPGLSLAIDEIPEGRSIEFHEGLPVEIMRAGEEIRARSLLCTHQGCVVQWRPAEGQYVCPCHQGRFDASGHPVSGPPRHPLREHPVTREGNLVLVDTRVHSEAS